MDQKTFVDRDYSLVSEAHFSVLHSSRLLNHTSMNTYQSYEEITHATQMVGS
jgi:hypothetical protein